MDIPPIKCVAKNMIQVTVDATLVYNITNLKKAIYLNEDPLNWFWQVSQQCVVEVVSGLDLDEMRQLQHLSNLIFTKINDTLQNIESGIVGLQCSRFVIQNVIIDPEIVRTIEKINTDQRKQNFMLEQNRAENTRLMEQARFQSERELDQARHQQTLQLLEQEKERQRAEHELSLREADVRKQAELRLVQADAESQAVSRRWKGALEVGFSTDQLIELQALETQMSLREALLQGPSNTVWASNEVLGLVKRRRLLGPIAASTNVDEQNG
jgi:hypothetical protein